MRRGYKSSLKSSYKKFVGPMNLPIGGLGLKKQGNSGRESSGTALVIRVGCISGRGLRVGMGFGGKAPPLNIKYILDPSGSE